MKELEELREALLASWLVQRVMLPLIKAINNIEEAKSGDKVD